MTGPVIALIIIGIIFIFASYFVSESLTKKEESFHADLLTVRDDYEFSDRERQIIKRKIEDVIAEHAKDILYETDESLSNMANEKTLALGDYAVTVCEEIERNHKEVMFLYSMLDDKQKEIMHTVQDVDKAKEEWKRSVQERRVEVVKEKPKKEAAQQQPVLRPSAIDQLTALKQRKERIDSEKAATEEIASVPDAVKPQEEKKPKQSAKSVNVEKNKDEDVEKEQDTLPDVETDELSDIDDVFDELDQADMEDVFGEELEQNANSNEIILQMHRNGENIISIARELGLGVGEVKLVIDLYQGE